MVCYLVKINLRETPRTKVTLKSSKVTHYSTFICLRLQHVFLFIFKQPAHDYWYRWINMTHVLFTCRLIANSYGLFTRWVTISSTGEVFNVYVFQKRKAAETDFQHTEFLPSKGFSLSMRDFQGEINLKEVIAALKQIFFGGLTRMYIWLDSDLESLSLYLMLWINQNLLYLKLTCYNVNFPPTRACPPCYRVNSLFITLFAEIPTKFEQRLKKMADWILKINAM